MIRTLSFIEKTLLLSALAGAGAANVVGCSSDDDKPANAAGTGGTDGGVDGTGGKTSSGGKTSAGGSNAGGSNAGGKDAVDASTDGGETPDATADAGPPLPALTGKAFVSAADFVANAGEVQLVDLATGGVLGHSTIDDGDISVRVSGTQAFVLERNGSALDVLSPTAAVTKHFNLFEGPDGAFPPYLNPHDVVSVSDTKAYVTLYGANSILVVDPAAGTLTKAIDLTDFMESSDTDGTADPDVGYFDAATKRAYFLLQRTDVNTVTTDSNFIASCLPGGPLVVAFDTDTDAVVDLNGAAAGVGIELPLPSPNSWTRGADGKFYVVSTGCATGPDGGVLRKNGGVSVVDVTAGTATALYQATNQDFLADLLPLTGTDYALSAFDGDTGDAIDTLFQAGTSPATLGKRFANVPPSATAVGGGQLVGIDFEQLSDGGLGQILSQYDTASERAGKVASLRWNGSYTFATVTFTK